MLGVWREVLESIAHCDGKKIIVLTELQKKSYREPIPGAKSEYSKDMIIIHF